MFKKTNSMSKAKSKSSRSTIRSSESEQSLADMIQVTKLLSSSTDTDDNDSSDVSSCKTFDLDEDLNVPLDPPYAVCIKNLPLNVSEREVRQLFADYSIRWLHLPRARGNTYMELETREELIKLLQKEAPVCRGRYLLISISKDLGNGRAVTKNAETESLGAGGDAQSVSITLELEKEEEEKEPPQEKQEQPKLPKQPEVEKKLSLSSLNLSRKPSSMEELEQRMQFRLQKLSEFENAQSARAAGADANGPLEPPLSWREFCKREGFRSV